MVQEVTSSPVYLNAYLKFWKQEQLQEDPADTQAHFTNKHLSGSLLQGMRSPLGTKKKDYVLLMSSSQVKNLYLIPGRVPCSMVPVACSDCHVQFNDMMCASVREGVVYSGEKKSWGNFSLLFFSAERLFAWCCCLPLANVGLYF